MVLYVLLIFVAQGILRTLVEMRAVHQRYDSLWHTCRDTPGKWQTAAVETTMTHSAPQNACGKSSLVSKHHKSNHNTSSLLIVFAFKA